MSGADLIISVANICMFFLQLTKIVDKGRALRLLRSQCGTLINPDALNSTFLPMESKLFTTYT